MPTRPELKNDRSKLEASARKIIKNIVNEEMGGEEVRQFLRDAMKISKRIRHDFACKSCGKHQYHYVDVPDHIGAVKVLEVLLNQANGRPQEEQEDSGVTVVYRQFIVQSKEEAEAIIAAEDATL